MLKILVPGRELYDESNNVFINTKDYILTLEHSLVSVSKWEAQWKKPFINKEKKTQEETISYIRCMTINQNVPNTVYQTLTEENVKSVYNYIDDKMSATWFSEIKNTSGRPQIRKEEITSELIYYWMIAYEIPFECQKWHLNRLMTLIRICNIKNKSPKKMSKRDILKRNSSLNSARKARLGTRG